MACTLCSADVTGVVDALLGAGADVFALFRGTEGDHLLGSRGLSPFEHGCRILPPATIGSVLAAAAAQPSIFATTDFARSGGTAALGQAMLQADSARRSAILLELASVGVVLPVDSLGPWPPSLGEGGSGNVDVRDALGLAMRCAADDIEEVNGMVCTKSVHCKGYARTLNVPEFTVHHVPSSSQRNLYLTHGPIQDFSLPYGKRWLRTTPLHTSHPLQPGYAPFPVLTFLA
jgi:hypothetical protein